MVSAAFEEQPKPDMDGVYRKKIYAYAGILATIAFLFFAFVVFIPQHVRIMPEGQGISNSLSPISTQTPTASVFEESATTSQNRFTNPITGEECANASRRPMAVMLSGDAIARPLSGISEADMVFEMPVITGSITRFMAVFVCRDPIEIGSVRSARHNFIPLAQGLNAIYAHWGGSHFALDLLKENAIDNIDALPNPASAFWRKDSAPAPHNGFTSMTRLFKAAKFLQYRLDGHVLEPYPHRESVTGSASIKGTLEIGYAGPFHVRYVYDPKTKSYQRIRGSLTERDKNSGETLYVRNVAVMRTLSRQIEGQYNDVVVEGNGYGAVYRGGEELVGTWKKDKNDPSSRLAFLDTDGQEIAFLPGSIWVEIVEPYTDVRWTAE